MPNPPKSFAVDSLAVRVHAGQAEMAADAARLAREILREALARNGSAFAVLATGNSQLLFLEKLIEAGGVDWARVTLFHMDEYLGIGADHPASFRRYMKERVETRVKPRAFHYMQGDALEPLAECERYAKLLSAQPIDLCCLGIGENGHLAFNDPPVADFQDKHLVKIVNLDRECRMQQVGEGHFKGLDDVPQYALTLTIPGLCLAKKMLAIVPEKRKARAVRDALRGPVSTACPGSFLRTQAQCTLLLDADSASLLS